jgi:hypothetical protein
MPTKWTTRLKEGEFVKSLALLAIAFQLTAITTWADDGGLESAQESALSWLTLTDNGQIESSWNAASTFFQSAISKSDWAHSLNAARSSFGELETREIASATFSRTLPGAPDGNFVVFQFDASFEKQASATETLAMMKDGEDAWRVAGYFIKS